jgi:GrpB-like predicted nucleotidyltransferase (UPF0157 family)
VGRSTHDPFTQWLELRDSIGDEAGVIALYTIAARSRQLQAHELPRSERAELAARALPVLFAGHQTTGGSGRGEPVVLAPYDAAWPARFSTWRRQLSEALGGRARRIEHVGSTAVPGLPAKPVIDIQVSVADPTQEADYQPALVDLGLQLRSRDDRHRYFRPFPGRARDVQVHVCRTGSRWEREHLMFCDYLRAHPRPCADYADLKRSAALRWADDRIAYTDAKGDLIRATLAAAEVWAREIGWTVGRAG